MEGFECSKKILRSNHLHVRLERFFLDWRQIVLHLEQCDITSLVKYMVGYDLRPLLASWL